MLEIKELKSIEELEKNNLTKDKFIDFLFTHLDRFGDPKHDIESCLDYAFSTKEGKGGFALAAFLDNEFVGALIMNKTGMSGYIPENILVYVAVDAEKRGHGIGGQVVEKAFELADGDVKLHVEYDNPAKRLYERCGMTTKYAEMRYKK